MRSDGIYAPNGTKRPKRRKPSVHACLCLIAATSDFDAKAGEWAHLGSNQGAPACEAGGRKSVQGHNPRPASAPSR
jgi:hypothetical protein